MALYKPSPIVGAISGNVGSVNFVAGAQRTTLRAARNPYSPRYSDQLRARANLATLVGMWNDLSDTDKATWTTIARQIKRTDRLGQARTLSGRQYFLHYNLRELQLGLTIYTTTVPVAATGMVWTSSTIVATSPTNITWLPVCTGHPFTIRFSLFAQAFNRTPPDHLPNRWRWYGQGFTPALGAQQQYPQIINATGALQSGQWFAIYGYAWKEGQYYDLTNVAIAQIP